MSLREEFVRLATRSGANRRELCRRFGEAGVAGLVDRSRRPKRSPRRTSPELEAAGRRGAASRYRPSERPDPERLPAVEYPAGDHVRKLQDRGWVELRGRRLHVPRGLRGPSVALRPLDEDGRWAIYFTTERVGTVDLRVSS